MQAMHFIVSVLTLVILSVHSVTDVWRFDELKARLSDLRPASYSISIDHTHPAPEMMRLRATGYVADRGALTKSGEEPVPYWTLSVSRDLWPALQGRLLFLPHVGIMGRVTDTTARWVHGTVDINVPNEREARMVTCDAADVLILPEPTAFPGARK